MNLRRFSLAVLAIFIFALVWNGLVHLVLLREANLVLEKFVRPSAERSLALALMETAGIAALFVYSYARFVHTPGLKRALEHGLFFGLLAGLLVDLNQFLLYPIPASLAAAWFVFGLAEFCLYGVLVCYLYPVKDGGVSTDASRSLGVAKNAIP